MLATDSATVFGWLKSVIYCRHNVRTKGLSELLIRRRLDILKEVITQEQLDVRPHLVRSQDNKADSLSRIPVSWARAKTREVTAVAGVGESSCVGVMQSVEKLHEKHHFGIDCMLALAREAFGERVSKDLVKRVVAGCTECARFCPAITHHWGKGDLRVARVCAQLATNVAGSPYLTAVDVASRFSAWFHLRNKSAQEVMHHLQQLFALLGPPEVLFSDNGTMFRSASVTALLTEWEVRHDFSCAYRSQGNGERMHHTIKTMVACTGHTVEDAVFWYNATPQKVLVSVHTRWCSERSPSCLVCTISESGCSCLMTLPKKRWTRKLIVLRTPMLLETKCTCVEVVAVWKPGLGLTK